MELAALILSGASAVMATVAVLLVAGLNSKFEQRRWRRDERIKALLGLKRAVSGCP